MRPGKPQRWRGITRDSVLFAVGLLGILHETLLHSGIERPTLTLVFAAFMGAPIFFRADERGKG